MIMFINQSKKLFILNKVESYIDSCYDYSFIKNKKIELRGTSRTTITFLLAENKITSLVLKTDNFDVEIENSDSLSEKFLLLEELAYKKIYQIDDKKFREFFKSYDIKEERDFSIEQIFQDENKQSKPKKNWFRVLNSLIIK